MNIVLSAIHFPLTIARYFWEALEMREDVNLWVCGPFSGNYIPWSGGLTLDQKYVKYPDFQLPIQSINQRVPAALVNSQVPFKSVDLWLNIDAGWCIEGRPDKAKIYAQIQTDPHVLKDRYRKYRQQHDFSFTMQTPYMDKGEIYLPYGYSSIHHYPEYLGEKEYDVCMIGLNYTHRDRLMRKLSAMGLKTKTGIGIVYNEYRHAYNLSKISLCWSSLQDLPARVWESMAMGIPVVCNHVPDLSTNGFEGGIHFLGFDNEAEAISQINHLLTNPKMASRMASNALDKIKGNSWSDRVQFILEKVGL